MIAISTLLYDLRGHIVLSESPKSVFPDLSRRVTRTATLDGNSTLNDLGFTDGDKTYVFSFDNLVQSQVENLEYLIKNYAIVRLSTADGCFLGSISRVGSAKNPTQLTFLVKQRISE